jgi:hypothetical protein
MTGGDNNMLIHRYITTIWKNSWHLNYWINYWTNTENMWPASSSMLADASNQHETYNKIEENIARKMKP